MTESGGSMAAESSPDGNLRPFRAAVTARGGGASRPPFASLNVGRATADDPRRVADNETRILSHFGLPNRVARLRLEHGTRILSARAPGIYGPGDALLTDRDDLVLWFTVADCYALTLVAGGWRAHGHCGWRGTAAGLPEALARRLSDASGLPMTKMRAWIGPGIGPCCYAIGPEVAARFPETSLRRDMIGTPRLDLQGDLHRRLRELGLPNEAIAASGACTCCQADRFFSHRRDGPTGRMAALCWRPHAHVVAQDRANTPL